MLRRSIPAAGLGLASLLAACGSDQDLSPYTIDTRDAERFPTGALVAHQQGDRWVPATAMSPGLFTFAPGGDDVVFAVACPPVGPEGASRATVTVEYGTLLDGERTLLRPCHDVVAAEGIDASVQVVPTGASLSIANRTIPSVGDDGIAQIGVRPGSLDVVSFTPDRVLVERGVTFPRSELFVMDVTSRGAERRLLDLAPPALAAGEQLSAEYAFRTAGGTHGVTLFPTTEVRVVPDELVVAGDRHRLLVAAERGLSRRWTLASSSQTTDLVRAMDLPHPFAEVTASTAGGLSVGWSGRPDEGASSLQVSITQHGDDALSWTALHDDAWLVRHDQDVDGSWTPPDLSSLPTWNPAWNLALDHLDETEWSLSTVELIPDGIEMRASWGNDWYGWFVE
jgi:hypothetical protein